LMSWNLQIDSAEDRLTRVAFVHRSQGATDKGRIVLLFERGNSRFAWFAPIVSNGD
jgi:hypothetical protein